MLALVGGFVACGTVDPAKPSEPSGSAGETASAGTDGGGSPAGLGGDHAGEAGERTSEGGNPAAGAGGVGGAFEPGTALPLLPWREGNSWTYRITKNGVVTEKTTVIGAEEPVGGVGPHADAQAFHVTTDKGAQDHTESWQAPSASAPERIVRFREQAFAASTGKLDNEVHYDPEKLHVDGSPERTVAGATWLEKYAETSLVVGQPPSTHSVSERWTVIADDEKLKVPAGTFEGVVHLQKVGNSTKEYWYARGVGKLKETGTQTEELTDYTVVP
jgi:hypothetical protein